MNNEETKKQNTIVADERIRKSLPYLFTLLGNPAVLADMDRRGLTVNWKAVIDIYFKVHGYQPSTDLLKSWRP